MVGDNNKQQQLTVEDFVPKKLHSGDIKLNGKRKYFEFYYQSKRLDITK